jgi:biotin carboxylase
MGSRGIFQLNSEDNLKMAFERAKKTSLDSKVLIEEFADGPEFSVETLTWNGNTEVIAVTDKITTGLPYWVEMGHTQPSMFSLNDVEAIKEATLKGIKALGIDWCAGHTEIKLTKTGPKIIEIGARLGGDFITTELTPRSTGIDIVEGAIQLSLGSEPRIEPWEKSRASAIRYIAPNPGKLAKIEGMEKARSIPGIVDIGVNYKIGDFVPINESSLHRTAWVISESDTREGAIALCEKALNLMKFITE